MRRSACQYARRGAKHRERNLQRDRVATGSGLPSNPHGADGIVVPVLLAILGIRSIGQMIRVAFIVWGFLIAAVPVRAADPAGIAVVVDGVANADGRVLVALCTRETFLSDKCPYAARAPAPVDGKVEIVLKDIAPGTYAVQAFHDENENFEIDRSFFGRPKEGMGFSNDAQMNYGPPDFDEAAIELKAGGNQTRLKLRYY